MSNSESEGESGPEPGLLVLPNEPGGSGDFSSDSEGSDDGLYTTLAAKTEFAMQNPATAEE